MLIGYARVSSRDQNLEYQLEALKQAGCDKIFQDVISGKSENPEGLAKATEHLREGDTFVVWKLDRLGRRVGRLIAFIGMLSERGVNFSSLTESIDTRTAMGRFFFHVMASFAEMERELNNERTKAGLEAARKLGRVGGRPRILTESKLAAAKKLLASNVTPRDVAENLGVSIATLYRWIPAK